MAAEIETHSGTSDRLKIVEVGVLLISSADGLMNDSNTYYRSGCKLFSIYCSCKGSPYLGYSTLKQMDGSSAGSVCSLDSIVESTSCDIHI